MLFLALNIAEIELSSRLGRCFAMGCNTNITEHLWSLSSLRLVGYVTFCEMELESSSTKWHCQSCTCSFDNYLAYKSEEYIVSVPFSAYWLV